MSLRVRVPLLLVFSAVVALGGCSIDTADESDGIRVAAAFYPLEFAVESVAGNTAVVTPLTTPGVEAHDVELTPRQMAAAIESDLLVYLAGFQPAIDEAVKQVDPAKVLDVGPFANLLDAAVTDGTISDDGAQHDEAQDLAEAGLGHTSFDPHFWLDPLRLAAVSDAIADRLADVDAAQSSVLHDGAQAVRTRLVELDDEFHDGLQSCARRELFTSHAAFGYMAERYDLEQVSVVGISPDAEPSGARIAEVQELARERDATTIFFEASASDAVATSIARDLGLRTAVLDPIELLSDQSAGEDYPAIMRANLTAIQEANDCG